MTNEEIFTKLRRDLPFLQREFGLKRLGVFGSWVRGSAHESSDVDLVAEFDQPSGLRFVAFAEHIEQLLGRKADILTSAGIATIRNARIARRIAESIVYV